MPKDIRVNENEINKMQRLINEGKSIKEVCELTHRSESSVRKYTVMKKKEAQEQIRVLDAFNGVEISQFDEDGIIKLKQGNDVVYADTENVMNMFINLVKWIEAKVKE